MVFEPVTDSISLRDRVVQDILRKIEGGELRAGDRLPPEREMAAQFHVSRATVRDALRTLAALGALSIEHGRGIFVRAGEGVALGEALWRPMVVEAQTISHLFEVRCNLETAAASWAARRATEQQRHHLKRIVLSVKEQMEEGGTVPPEVLAVADLEFHGAVLDASHNPVAGRIMLNLLDALEDARRHSLSIEGRAVKSVLDHESIADAIVRGDAPGAERAMQLHLVGVESEILHHLQEIRVAR